MDFFNYYYKPGDMITDYGSSASVGGLPVGAQPFAVVSSWFYPVDLPYATDPDDSASTELPVSFNYKSSDGPYWLAESMTDHYYSI